MTNKVRSEDVVNYESFVDSNIKDEDDIIAKALEILQSRMVVKGVKFNNPNVVKNFLKVKLSELEHEVFSVLFLDNQHRLIEYVELFRGTIDGASVYPREVVKEALKCNAAAVIFAHNHPSGSIEPSSADRHITQKLKDALNTVDINTRSSLYWWDLTSSTSLSSLLDQKKLDTVIEPCDNES